jgi:hypothetical protein
MLLDFQVFQGNQISVLTSSVNKLKGTGVFPKDRTLSKLKKALS